MKGPLCAGHQDYRDEDEEHFPDEAAARGEADTGSRFQTTWCLLRGATPRVRCDSSDGTLWRLDNVSQR